MRAVVVLPELMALVVALATYTASYIAEIVRAGIEGVARGQTEAAQALGLNRGQLLRLIIVPQAMRQIIPPLTSQYLNLTKNRRWRWRRYPIWFRSLNELVQRGKRKSSRS
jgi:general L-amino acid transport system permease protein